MMRVLSYTLVLDEKLVCQPLADFPRSEHWRLVTDGFQQPAGPANFTFKFYQGMQDGFKHIQQHIHSNTKITPEFIEQLNLVVQGQQPSNSQAFRAQKGNVTFQLAPMQEVEAGYSRAGIDEFVKAVIEAEDDRRWCLLSLPRMLDSSFKFAISDAASAAEKGQSFSRKYRMELKEKLLKCLDARSQTELYLCGFMMERPKVIEALQKDLDKLYSDLDGIEQESKQVQSYERDRLFQINIDLRYKKIAAIVQFIQKLNQNHWFADGNGRTCILLLDLLLLQQLGCMAIPMTPGHLTGYSTDELVKEIQNGIDEIEKYKITLAKDFLCKIKVEDLEDEKEAAKKLDKFACDLADKLSPVNYIAMAQINELFLQIKEGKIDVPAKVKGKILDVLKKLYLENLHDFATHPPKGSSYRIPNVTAFDTYLSFHEISREKDIAQEVNKKMEFYFKKTPHAQVRPLQSGMG